MSSPGADPERMLARLTALGLIMQGLLERLILSGKMDASDLDGIRRFALDLTDDLKAHSGTDAQIGGARTEEEINAFFEVVGYPPEGNDDSR